MNVLELKGEMHDLISKVRDGKTAEQLLVIIREFIGKNVQGEPDFEKSMTPDEEEALRRAIARSHDRANFISADDAEKRLSRWLNP